MKSSVKGGIIATILFASAAGAYHIGTMNVGVTSNQPTNLPSSEVVEQIVDFRPTGEDPTPSVVETEGNFDSQLELLTTPEGRSSRRDQLFYGISELIDRSVERFGGWYTAISGEGSEQTCQVLVSQIGRYLNSHLNTEFTIAQEYANSINMRLDGLIPENMSSISREEKEVLLTSLLAIQEEFHSFYNPRRGDNTFSMISREFSVQVPGTPMVRFLPNREELFELAKLDWLNDYLTRFDLTDDELRQVRGASSSTELREVATTIAQARVDANEPFDFTPYQIRFLDSHNLPHDLAGRSRENERDFISWMLWVYRSPMKDRALEGVDESSLEYDEIVSEFSVYQPEHGWGSRTESLWTVENEILREVSDHWDSYVLERDENIKELSNFSNVIRRWHVDYKNRLKRPATLLVEYTYRHINNPKKQKLAVPLQETSERISTLIHEVRNL